jgi:hypothetical protein
MPGFEDIKHLIHVAIGSLQHDVLTKDASVNHLSGGLHVCKNLFISMSRQTTIAT